MFETPKATYPTLVTGFINGPVRIENIEGEQRYLTPGTLPYESRQGNVFKYVNVAPFRLDGKIWFVTHIQNKATYFSLTYDPFIYHFGKFWRLQQKYKDANGVEMWKPGSEQGIYFRTPGWRWQIPDKRSNYTTWIWSWGRVPGTHLD